ncbi:ABC transporter substrate-binding protein [Harryflintia acetispora]|uniref:Raffinose/stachyose/melibiose transport system substrate-binding protein n=1 Tax=Harryflintia acetispora TaxID=1849041 RepID=A0A9X8Y7J3_9FIRM|nr:extracellular solute-binding protein [Harryflintia acetispora]TCL42464.1 raffinose/stachyose/melibiose transport system substrate-binding protein [Harryflintia acetispora]
MTKKMALIMALIMALSLTFTACGSPAVPDGSSDPGGAGQTPASSEPAAQADGDKIVLDVMHRFSDEPFKGFFESITQDWLQKNPDTEINMTFTATDPYAEKLTILMASNDPPDVFFSFPGEFLNKFVREGLVYDLAEEYEKNTAWQENYNSALLEPFRTEDGALYGLDYDLTVKLFFYNIDIFNEYGLTPPKTWNELIHICEVLQSNGVLPISEGDADQWPATHLLAILFHVMVPQEVRDVDYNPTSGEWTDPAYLDALAKYTELAQYMNDDMVSITHGVARMDFATGGSGMAFLESIEITNVEEDSGGNLNYGMFKFPTIPGAPGDQDMLLGSPEGFSMSSKCEHPEKALDYLGYITGPEVGKRMSSEIGWFNASKGSLDKATAPQMLSDVYDLLMGTKGLVNWIDNECHTLLRDVFYSRTQEFLNGTMSAEEYMGLIQAAAAEAKTEMGG